VSADSSADVREREQPFDVELTEDEQGHAARHALYVARRGASVRRHGRRLRVEADDQLVVEVPAGLVDRAVLLGSVHLSGPARTLLLEEGAEIVLLGRMGGYLGRFEPASGTSSRRRRQLVAVEDDAFATRLAAGIIAAKVSHQRTLLLRYHRRADDSLLAVTVERLDALGEQCRLVDSRPSLLGLEGSAARLYFEGIETLLPGELRFRGRTGRHAGDAFNATLNFTYALLLSEVTAAVASVGLDPATGVLHTDFRGRASMALDLMEEFRPIIADATVVDLFRRRLLTGSEATSIADRCRLTDEGRRRCIDGYERRLATIVTTASGERTTFRRAIHLQARQLARRIDTGEPIWEPLQWR